jgi:anti-sigma B factor antagonist
VDDVQRTRDGIEGSRGAHVSSLASQRPAACHVMADGDPGDTAVLVLEGEFCLETMGVLEGPLAAALDTGAPVLLLDLAGTTFMDVRTLGLLLDAVRRLRARGGRLVLVAPPRIVRRLLVATACGEHFEVQPVPESAALALYAAS